MRRAHGALARARARARALAFGCWLAALVAAAHPVRAQQIDFSRGGPIAITASGGLEWHQNEQRVVARGDAKAVRGNVTVTADQLIAYYRKKAPPARDGQPGAPAVQAAPTATRPAGPPAGAAAGGETSGNEIYRLEAVGHVRIVSPTEQVTGERAVYDIDQAVMLMTGGALKLTTPNQTLTARDSLEYWAQKRMSVARGNAVVVTNDGRRVQADTLVAFSRDDGGRGGRAPRPAVEAAPDGKPGGDGPLGAAGSGKLERVEAFGNVIIRTSTDTVVGDRAVYVSESGLARVGGNVRITRGQNQFSGADAVVNTNTGVAQLLAGASGRVAGLVIPSEGAAQPGGDAALAAPLAAAPARPQRRRGATQ